jgi:hypothetical protein
MACLLLDENISPVVADQIVRMEPSARILALAHWNNGEFLGTDDDLVLTAAALDKHTLVTFDLKTIVPILKTWGDDGKSHGGVILIDDKSIASNDFGRLVRAISQAWRQLRDVDFTDRTMFLRPSP